jgi:predicted dehydrogenase/threonine dehydrogenase-like Zn-dependent dehydrogenase
VKQVTQRLRDGKVEVLDVPPPEILPGTVLVSVRASLLSAGTERAKIETGRQSLVAKARSRPDQARKVIEAARRDGLRDTVQAVRARLGQPSPLGYSAAGVVTAVGGDVRDLAPGDPVACAGAEHAFHAEIDRVPANLCVRVPQGVGFGQAAFATVGSIALHGVRQADVRVGERVAVIGLGLVGQLTVQILRASGCAAVGIDLSPSLVALALRLGAAEAIARDDDTGPFPDDCDAVIVTAATRSSDPVEVAARLCRDRGRVVVVGDVGLQLPRSAYYEKELEIRLSRSYGPGRYDREYEERGLDYPIGYVRWTERRNMAAFLDLVASGAVDVDSLVTQRVPVERAPEAYESLVRADTSPLGILIEYVPDIAPEGPSPPKPASASAGGASVGVIGAGNFAMRVLIPGLKRAGFGLVAVGSSGGLSARVAADEFGFARATTPSEILNAADLDLVAIATRHASHAELAVRALRAGKAVFVEKPPALDRAQLDELRAARDESGRHLLVGFNRRYAPLARELRTHVVGAGAPVELIYRVNPGRLEDHWLDDLQEGGGRLLGEGCHFVDFACWLVRALPERIQCVMRPDPGQPFAAARSFSIILDFPGGSCATIVYLASGAAALGKEYVEAHAGERSATLDDFRLLRLMDGRRAWRRRTRRADKGHAAQFAHLRSALQSEAAPDDVDPLDTMSVTLDGLTSAEMSHGERTSRSSASF